MIPDVSAQNSDRAMLKQRKQQGCIVSHIGGTAAANSHGPHLRLQRIPGTVVTVAVHTCFVAVRIIAPFFYFLMTREFGTSASISETDVPANQVLHCCTWENSEKKRIFGAFLK